MEPARHQNSVDRRQSLKRTSQGIRDSGGLPVKRVSGRVCCLTSNMNLSSRCPCTSGTLIERSSRERCVASTSEMFAAEKLATPLSLDVRGKSPPPKTRRPEHDQRCYCRSTISRVKKRSRWPLWFTALVYQHCARCRALKSRSVCEYFPESVVGIAVVVHVRHAGYQRSRSRSVRRVACDVKRLPALWSTKKQFVDASRYMHFVSVYACTRVR